jgi:hypothetical protein
MKAAGLSIGVTAAVSVAVLIGPVLRASAQSKLPEGANREFVEVVCGSCHDIEMVAINGRSRANWDGTIDEMIGYGMRLTQADRALVLDYLATYLPPK